MGLTDVGSTMVGIACLILATGAGVSMVIAALRNKGDK